MPDSDAIVAPRIVATAAQRLRHALASGRVVAVPSVWDGLSARLASQAGFAKLFLSGLCVAAARLDGPDLDLLSFAEMLDSLRMVREAAPSAAVIADADHGFGNAMNVERTVRPYGHAGAAPVMIEDKLSPPPLDAEGKPCVSRDEARTRIRAAIGAAREADILVLARTDSRPSRGVDEALARIALFVAEGTDIVMLDSPASEAEVLLAVEAAQGRPLFCALTGEPSRAPVSPRRAQQLGVNICTFPFATLAPAVNGMQHALASLADGLLDPGGRFDRESLRETLGYPAYETRARTLMRRS